MQSTYDRCGRIHCGAGREAGGGLTRTDLWAELGQLVRLCVEPAQGLHVLQVGVGGQALGGYDVQVNCAHVRHGAAGWI